MQRLFFVRKQMVCVLILQAADGAHQTLFTS